jgi:DNA-binding Lrp family transcriptional regulator
MSPSRSEQTQNIGRLDVSGRFVDPAWRGQVADLPRFDETDSQIAEALCRDGRQSFRDIAKLLNVSEGTVRNRYKRLVQSGTLRVSGFVNPMAVGYDFMALLGLRVDGPVEEIADIAMEPREVDYGVITTGRFDIVMECVCVSRKQLLEQINRVTQLQDVVSVEVFTYFSLFKYLANWNAPDSSYDVPRITDTLDFRIIQVLHHDGRQSFREVARQLNVAEATVRTRFNRLVGDGVFRVAGLYNGVSASAIGGLVGLTVSSDLTPIAAAISSHPRVGYVVLTAGRYNIVAELFCSSPSEFLDAISEWRRLPGVASTESLPYIKMCKQVLDWPTTEGLWKPVAEKESTVA